ncbi:phosphatase PAP2 family protein [Natronobacterium texcoconense]|uniref:PAP2 superfamily protein n=1 Tax=Natronobacterium texcoconense TaxID=1095778 RepID=A0A1H1C7F8_NATTX|nr:phosphatase PAP2 family protein [Natronobacterium texcoconense]SDQ60122.1 PAP2 superfamily protein [Natronobacterium texcoconense]
MGRTTLETLLFDESTNEAVRAALPDPAIPFFETVTHLGDGATLLVLLATMYWFGAASSRRTRALVIGIGLLGFSVSAGLKGAIAAPRPDVTFTHAVFSPYSFPSGHALGSATVYGAIAVYAELWTKRVRYLLAGTIIVLVSLSRVVIGAHFLGDVLAGMILGIAIVALVYYADPDPGYTFVLAGAIAVLSFAFGSTHYTTLTTGAAIGAALAWTYARDRSTTPRGASLLVLGAVVVPILVAVRLITVDWNPHWIGDVVGYAAVVGFAVLLPEIAATLDDRPVVERLQETLPFAGRTVDPGQVPPRERE